MKSALDSNMLGISRKEYRIQLLALILVAELMVLVWMLPGDPMIAARFNSLFHPAQPPNPITNADLQKDPPIGLTLTSGSIQSALRNTPSPAKGYLLVPVGTCAMCLNADLRSWQRMAAAQGVCMALLSSAPEKSALSFQKHLGLSCPVVYDPSNALSQQLNVMWPARPYLFSTHWNLLWMPRTRQLMYNPFQDKQFQQAQHGGLP